MNRIQSIAIAGFLALALVLSPSVHAQAFPSKVVQIVVPYPPGGQVDLLARMVAQNLEKSLGQPVIVDYKAGFAGNMGIEHVSKAPPDGYTLVIAPAGNLTINPHLYSTLRYNVLTDLAPVTLLATADNVLVVNSQIPAKNVQELVALARAKPGTLSFASSGVGSLAHIAGELLKKQAAIDMLHVSYKGGAPAIVDMLGNRVSMMFLQMSLALPHIKPGGLRPLAVAKLKRSPLLPDVPTMDEQGIAGFEAVSWYALMAPAGTPREVIARLNAEVTRILKQTDVRDKLVALGVDPAGSTPEELDTLIRTESKRWARVVQDAQIKPLD